MTEIFESWPKSEIMSFLGHRNEEEFMIEFAKHREGYSCYNRRFLVFLLIDKQSSQVIGRCGIHNWNEENNRAEIGYVINDDQFRNQGLMQEAVSEVLKFGFQVLNLHKIDAIIGVSNMASLRIVEKCRFQKEGHLRDYLINGKCYEDAYYFGLLNDTCANK